MSRRLRTSHKPGHAYLLDTWQPPLDAGEPVGCLATSFTFDAAFFEEQCLARFAGLEAEREDENALYLLEREERLAQLSVAAALVDHHHAAGERSLRWDLLVARPRSGRFHPKIALLRWSRRLRLVIGSANLTPDGYRSNREVFVVFDYHDDSEAPLPVLADVLGYLEAAALELAAPGAGRDRWIDFLRATRTASSSWGDDDVSRVRPVLVRPGQKSLPAQLRQMGCFDLPVSYAEIVSPFFDEGESSGAANAFIPLLGGPRTEATLRVVVEAEDDHTIKNGLVVKAPASLDLAAKKTGRVALTWATIKSDAEEDHRPLHAKTLWLQNRERVLYLIGSSNFTTAGHGLTQGCNWEANVAFLSRLGSEKDIWLGDLPTEDVDEMIPLRFQVEKDPDEPDPGADSVLPDGFGSVELEKDTLSLGFLSPTLPAGWRACFEDGSELIADEVAWLKKGAPVEPERLKIELHGRRAPSYLMVLWDGAPAPVVWPVTVSEPQALPLPAELRDLSLEQIMLVLASSKSLAKALGRKGKGDMKSAPQDDSVTDPHERANQHTASYLLQRTRRVTGALTNLRERLERPCASPASLAWRISGPAGLHAFIKALKRESQSVDETGFLLGELAMELKRVRLEKSEDAGLPVKTIQAALDAERNALTEQVRDLLDELSPSMSHYLRRALRLSA